MWEAPKKDRRYLLYVPDYTLPYFFKGQNISGFSSVLSSIGHDLWKGITYIPKKVYNLGYHIFNHKSNPSGVVTQGANDLHVLANASPGAGAGVYTTGKVKPSAFESFWNTIKKLGEDTASKLLQYKILQASQQSGIPQSQAYNQSLAWAIANEDALRKMGYPSPEAAASEALWQNNGLPPSPGQGSSLIPAIETEAKKYWWILALLGVALFMRKT